MMPALCKPGARVRSISDGFTRGWVGTVESLGRGGDRDEPAAFVRSDDGSLFAVAVRLLEAAPSS